MNELILNNYNSMNDDEREMRQAVLKLREICKKIKDCYECPAYNSDYGCMFHIPDWEYPYYWDIPVTDMNELA